MLSVRLTCDVGQIGFECWTSTILFLSPFDDGNKSQIEAECFSALLFTR